MYSSSSQDSQKKQGQFMASIHTTGRGHLYSNGGYENKATVPPTHNTAAALQREYFNQYYTPQDTGSATHHSRAIHPYNQHAPVANPSLPSRNAHAPPPSDHRGGNKASPPVNGQANESSTSVLHFPLVRKSYAKELLKESRTYRKDEVVTNAWSPAQTIQVMGPGPLAPADHLVVPQEIFFRGPSTPTYPPIEFIPKGFHKYGNETIQRLSASHHKVEHSQDMVLSHVRVSEIMIKIQWPGYPHFHFETPITTHKGSVTRGELIDLVCNAVVEFVETMKNQNMRVRKEEKQWMIGAKGLKMNNFFVARLLHRGGNYFQPEIWVTETKHNLELVQVCI